MNGPQSFLLDVSQWLLSRTIAKMKPEQEGAYIRLLCWAWESGDCSIPDDDAELATLSRLGDRWDTLGKLVKEQFEPIPEKPGFLRNARLYEEWLYAVEKLNKCRKSGTLGGRKKPNAKPDGIPIGIPNAKPNGSIFETDRPPNKGRKEEINKGTIPHFRDEPERIGDVLRRIVNEQG